MAKPRQKLSTRERLLIIALYEDGKTDNQIAKIIGIPRKTLTDICKYNGISATIKSTKTKPNEKVEKSLYIRATGFDYDEIKTEEIELIGSQHGIRLRVPAKKITTITKFIAPDTGAACMWLKNRGDGQGIRWKDRIDHDFSKETIGNLSEFLKQCRQTQQKI